MLEPQRLSHVMAIAALGASLACTQAAAGCRPQGAEALLDATPAAGDSGFALSERLCAATVVRSAVPLVVAQVATAAVRAEASTPAPVPLPGRAAITPPTPRPARVDRDASGQARIRALAPLMAEVAVRHDIDPLLLHAVAHIESRHQAQAISHAGARGLMQVMPATGRDMGVAEAAQLLNPQPNLEASARYLKRLQARFGNDLTLVLAAYNAGEGAVERHGRRVPPYAETQAYVRNVMAVYAELRRWFGGPT
ncbi:MAG: lytic transglycosylase domain-containing protein [Roseateles sp.]|uniref:lytic transglycosylase domain-containing protein n=1 Tax=Roseateles sp. TaxID=1971397 RepID=UPI004036E344